MRVQSNCDVHCDAIVYTLANQNPESLMGMWDFIAIAVVSGCLLEGYRIHSKARRSKHADKNEIKSLEQRLAALEKRIDEDLETRTRALEAVVTDADHQLGKDIESLKS